MDPSRMDECVEQALDALRQGNHARTLSIADQLAAAIPDEPLVCVIRAQALLDSDAVQDALVEAKRAVALDPQNPYAHLLLAWALWRLQKLTPAQQSFERAVELSGRRSEFLDEYAWFMAYERGPKLAERAAAEAVRADEKSASAWAALGLARLRLHRMDDAEAALKRALKLDPNSVRAQSAMVILLQKQGKDSSALALTNLVEDSPGSEAFVDAVRAQAKERRISRVILEREEVQDELFAEPRRHLWAWIGSGVLLVGTLLLLFRPDSPGSVFFCVVIPLLCLWRLWRAYQ